MHVPIALPVPNSIRQDYHELFDNDCTFHNVVDGKVCRRVDDDHESFLFGLINIENFVAEVLSCDAPAFCLQGHPLGPFVLREYALAKYFKEVSRLSFLYVDGYEISETCQLFFECWGELGLGQEAFMEKRGYSSVLGKEPFERFNDFLALIRQKGRSAEFRRRLSRRREKGADNQRRGLAYLEELFRQTYSKLLVLRVDFGYLQEYGQGVEPDQARQDIGHLFKRAQQHRQLGEAFMGYIWKLEWAPKKGCHFHTIVVYDGQQRRSDIHWAEQLGELWKQKITRGKGVYWNCNRHKENYAYPGIGQIHKNDPVKRLNLLCYVLGYLTKTDQYLLADSLKGGRCFQTGHLDESKKQTGAR